MTHLVAQLDLPRCPHCGVNTPSLSQQSVFETVGVVTRRERAWGVYHCSRCGGVVVASANSSGGWVDEVFPASPQVSDDIPMPAKKFLQQSLESLHVPEGSIMLAASAVDAMLKSKGYKEGSLYNRIDQAVKKGLITKEMSHWAHSVRLDANEQRHVDETAADATHEDASRSLDFALALGEFIFVLPAKVNRGISPPKEEQSAAVLLGNSPDPPPASFP